MVSSPPILSAHAHIIGLGYQSVRHFIFPRERRERKPKDPLCKLATISHLLSLMCPFLRIECLFDELLFYFLKAKVEHRS